MIQLIECPRDAMQGWKIPIPTRDKIMYIQQLLEVGFHTLDCGSFVSAKAIPQMADTSDVIKALDLSGTPTKLLTIVANKRGAATAIEFEQISDIGFPFSISPTFQQKNTNSSIEDSFETVIAIQDLCIKHHKNLVIYLSMGFGNPYGDDYNSSIVFEWARKIAELGVQTISLADTVGVATPELVYAVTQPLIQELPHTEIGVHLHAHPNDWKSKVDAALKAGCLRFDGALYGMGGCPMANDALVGNMNSAAMIPYFQSLHLLPEINETALKKSLQSAARIFGYN